MTTDTQDKTADAALETVRTDRLELPGASIYYEVRGSGPVLLMMPGGPADAGVFGRVAPHLAQHYTVVTYDPRGLGHSTLKGPIDDKRIVELFADDAHRLLAAVAINKAFVFANSGGAVIGLQLATRHAEEIDTLVAHEPPKFGPADAAGSERPDSSDELFEIYRTQGVGPAMTKFMVDAGLGEPSPHMLREMEAQPNPHFFLGHYIRGLAHHEPDVAAVRAAACRVVPAVGEDSRGEAAHLGGLGLAERLGTDAMLFPGGHGGFISHPVEFAARLRQTLDG